MTACMQPACTGTIVDGYCDVCGSPAGAVPFVPAEAAASAALPAPADGPGLMAVRRVWGLSPEPKKRDLMTACTQPGCTGTTVDGYCDVCGSPAAAVPFVLAEAAALAASAASADEPGLAAVPTPIPAPAHVAEEMPTQRIPRVKVPTQQLSAAEMADPEAADSAAVEEEMPTQPIPRVKVPTQQLSAAEMADPEAADSAAVEEEMPTQPIPRVKVPTQQLSAAEMADPEAADSAPVEEEMPTQPIPRVKVPTQQLSTNEMADPGAADRPDLDAQKVDGEKELAEEQLDGAQDYRTRVEEAELPDDVRDAALCEVGKLERTSDQSPESGEIRIWLDTILDLPWSTKTTDWIDIQGSREVEATLRKLIEPAAGDVEEGGTAEVEAVVGDVEEGGTAEVEAVVGDVEEGDAAEVEAVVADVGEGDAAEVEAVVADVEEGDAAEVEAVVGDVEEGDTAEVEAATDDTERTDTAPAGPYDDDTIETPAVLAGFRGRGYPRPQLPEQRVVEPVLIETPAEKRRFRYLAQAAIALAAMLIGALLFGALLFGASRDGGVTAQSVPTVTATATATVSIPTNEPSHESTGSGREEPTIQLEDLADSAKPFEAVSIQGTYRGGAGTFLRVQRWQGGQWLDFPLPTKIDQAGQFITQAEFGQPGRYRLRVLDPDSGVTSKPFVVVVKG